MSLPIVPPETHPIAILTDAPLDGFLSGQPIASKAVPTPFSPTPQQVQLHALGHKVIAVVRRQGEHLEIMPTEIDHRTHFYALKKLGVRFVISVISAWSLREMIHPGMMAIPGQIVPGLAHGPHESFFGQGIAAQVDLHHPICTHLQTLLFQSSKTMGADAHWNSILLALGSTGTATKSECDAYRRHACDLISPLQLTEARLALEAEMSYACLAYVTNYALPSGGQPVSVKAPGALISAILSHLVLQIPSELQMPAHSALKGNISTPKEFWPAATVERLGPILKAYL